MPTYRTQGKRSLNFLSAPGPVVERGLKAVFALTGLLPVCRGPARNRGGPAIEADLALSAGFFGKRALALVWIRTRATSWVAARSRSPARRRSPRSGCSAANRVNARCRADRKLKLPFPWVQVVDILSNRHRGGGRAPIRDLVAWPGFNTGGRGSRPTDFFCRLGR